MASTDVHPSEEYQPPTIQRLGTLAELTLGGDVSSLGDGFGAAGDSASI